MDPTPLEICHIFVEIQRAMKLFRLTSGTNVFTTRKLSTGAEHMNGKLRELR